MTKGTHNTLIWLARILGGLAVIFFGIFVIGEGAYDLRDSQDFRFRSMLLLLAFTSVAYVFAWWKPREGGVAMSIAAVIMGLDLFYFGGTKVISGVLIYALPFLVPGLIFWYAGKE